MYMYIYRFGRGKDIYILYIGVNDHWATMRVEMAQRLQENATFE